MKNLKFLIILSVVVSMIVGYGSVFAQDVVNEDGGVLINITNAVTTTPTNEGFKTTVDRAKLPATIRDEVVYIGVPSFMGAKYNLYDPYQFRRGGNYSQEGLTMNSGLLKQGYYYNLVILYDKDRNSVAYGETTIDFKGAGTKMDGESSGTSSNTNGSSTNTKVKEGLYASEESIDLVVGQSVKVKVYSVSATGKEVDVTANKSTVYRTNSSSVANVAAGGVVKAGTKAGAATLTISYGGKSLEIPVTVKAVGVKSIAVTPAKMTLGVEQSKQIKVQAIMDDNTRKDVTKDAQFFSNDTEVADVEDGDVYGIGVGETTIAVNYEGKEKEVVVEVQEDVELALEKLEISEKSVKLKASQQMELYVTGVFEDDSRDDVTGEVLWQSSKGSVATVTDGILVAKGIGVATITASLKGMKVQVKVTVEKAKKVKSLSVSKSALNIVEGQTATAKVTATYVDNSKEDVTSKVIWNVIDSDVVDVKSGKFYALDLGTTKVTGKFDGKLVTVNVNVK